MFTPDLRAKISIVFRDREGNERSTELSFPFDLSDSLIHTYMDMWTVTAGALSNAGIVAWSITRGFDDRAFVRPTDGSTIHDRLVLYYSSGPDFDRIIIPSARVELFEMDGPYEGIRVDMSRPEIVDLITSMQAVVLFIVTPEATEFPTNFVVGGLML